MARQHPGWRLLLEDWDVFSGQLARPDRSIFDVYKEAGTDVRFPFWANPIPVFVDPRFDRRDNRTWSFIATLAQPVGNVPRGCDPQPSFANIPGFSNCRHFTGTVDCSSPHRRSSGACRTACRATC